MKTYKYRIYPSKAQETLLNQQLEICRLVYNKTLAIRKDTYEQEKKSLGLYDTQKLLTAWKVEKPQFKLAHSQVLQNVQVRVDLAFKAFFRRVKAGEERSAELTSKPGYPRFKGYGRYDSMCFPQYGNGVTLDSDKLNLSKIGSIKVELHRELCGAPNGHPPLGAKTVCIRRGSTGKWFAAISCECEKKLLPQELKAIGVDVGTATFATLSNGEKIKNPRFFRKEQDALAKAQRRLEKVAKGTLARSERKKVVARIHERIANKRTDFAHKQSRTLVNTYGVLVFEDLNITSMMSEHTVVFGNKRSAESSRLDLSSPKRRSLNKSIADVAWNQFAQFAAYKAADAGRLFLQVDPRNTSKKCSRCSALVDKDLSVRVHNCPHCGLVLDRDHNAATNILALGLQRMGSIPRSPRVNSWE